MPAQLEGAVSAIHARLFVRELDARRIACDAALAAAGMSREILSDRRFELGWTQCLTFIDRALELVAGDDLAVCAGARADLTDLDLVGLYLRSASNGREAFQFHRENRAAFEDSSLTHIYTTDTTIVIALVPKPASRARDALAECILASTMAIMPQIAGPIAPLEVCFRHRRPADDSAHRRVFGAVRFECDVDAVVLPIELIDRPLPHRDDTIRAVLAPHLARQVEAAQAARASDLPTRVLYGIREELAEGRSSVESLAKRLRMSPRSLRRGLRVVETSYSDLLARARRDLALQHALESPRRSGPDIAKVLGYADAHTFYRAFKRWTGVSLSAYRKQSWR